MAMVDAGELGPSSRRSGRPVVQVSIMPMIRSWSATTASVQGFTDKGFENWAIQCGGGPAKLENLRTRTRPGHVPPQQLRLPTQPVEQQPVAYVTRVSIATSRMLWMRACPRRSWPTCSDLYVTSTRHNGRGLHDPFRGHGRAREHPPVFRGY